MADVALQSLLGKAWERGRELKEVQRTIFFFLLNCHSLCPVGFVSFLHIFLCIFFFVYILFLFSKWVCVIIWGNRNKWQQGKDWQQKAGIWGSRIQRWLLPSRDLYRPSGQRFISPGRVWQVQEGRRREQRYKGSRQRCCHRCSFSKYTALIGEADWYAKGKRREGISLPSHVI